MYSRGFALDKFGCFEECKKFLGIQGNILNRFSWNLYTRVLKL